MKVCLKYILFVTVLLFSSCHNKPDNVTRVDQFPPIFPDYVDVTIPVGIAPLNFNVVSNGDNVPCVDVIVKGSIAGELHSNGSLAQFDIDDWQSLVASNIGGHLAVTVCAYVEGKWIQYNDFSINISEHLLDDWGLTYRRIAPGYEVYSKMGIYQRELSSFDEFAIIENSNVYGMCVNCHTSNRANPNQIVFHVRGDHGATMIQLDGKREWLKALNDSIGGSMVYPYWHPSGRYCAFSTNQTRQGFHVSDLNRIEVFDMSSDILVYNPTTHEIVWDSLLTTKDWSENCPVFSPDGKKLYFITCCQQSYPMHYKDEKYNLCSIDFNPDDGTFGDKVDTLFNAVAIGKSLTWPKPSYDGKHLLFTLIDYGYFSIWHREAEQWILDIQTGKARPIDEINSNESDSFHNWSSNSRWIVFTSRRANGLYSQLFLASIDENGQATKPFLLPQKNPLEYYENTLFSFNTPDFTKKRVSFDSKTAYKEILSDNRTQTKVRE
ncbi:MAG: hypothetical protein MJZ13_05595 [Bacteroidales bacterium]|nr:hypothetical protein [Bacteroidales bacterium]